MNRRVCATKGKGNGSKTKTTTKRVWMRQWIAPCPDKRKLRSGGGCVKDVMHTKKARGGN